MNNPEESGFKEELSYVLEHLDAVLKEQIGKIGFRRFTKIRDISAAVRRNNRRQDVQAKQKLIAKMNLEESYAVAHAFSLYFLIHNLIEERARVRYFKQHPRPKQSLVDMFQILKDNKVSPDRLAHCLKNLYIQPVLTAHPTEAKRRTLLNHIMRLSKNFNRPDEIIETLWQTEEVRAKHMHPINEVQNTLFLFERSLFKASINFYQNFDRLLKDSYPKIKRKNFFLTFASWVGGDRDGNPYVTPEVSLETLRLHGECIRNHYINECKKLVEELSQASLGSEEMDPVQTSKISDAFHPREWFRKKIYATLKFLQENPTDYTLKLLHDLTLVKKKLQKQRAWRSASGRLDRVIHAVRIFQAHMAELDYREHTDVLYQNEPAFKDQLKSMRAIQDNFGSKACARYILSMTHNIGPIIKTLETKRRFAIKKLDIVPLFETIEDLERSCHILRELWATPIYMSHLKSQANVQEVMLGYSDSNKDGGYLAANWHLHKAQRNMAQLAKEYGVKLRFFHGKGGSIARGGGQSFRTLLAQPHAAWDNAIRFTEQGEVASLKYANPLIAERNLEQITCAVILANCLDSKIEPDQQSVWDERMEKISNSAYSAYQDLVFRNPLFSEYFMHATPIDLVEHLILGSRPARRADNLDFKDLRAIPWVFALSQSRHFLSAWYGMGKSLEDYEQSVPEGIAHLRELYLKWPFFKTLVDNAEVSLAKTDLYIAERYASLVKSPETRNVIFNLIKDEYNRTVRMVLAITSQKELLTNQPRLAQSIRMRNPYVDPLNYLQINMLQVWRTTPVAHRNESLRRFLALTVNGIAFGLKETG